MSIQNKKFRDNKQIENQNQRKPIVHNKQKPLKKKKGLEINHNI